MKNKGFKEEEKHLVEVQSKFEEKIQSEKLRLTDENLDQQRQDFIDFSIHQLENQKESPYFGRIDVQFEGEPEVEKMYIGSSTFFDEEKQVLVYDWRAPIASLFYEGTLGDLTYQTPSGIQHGQASLKRDIVIKKGKIQSVYDVENEESLLMETLSAPTNRDGHLEGITATIQKEQNEIIRHKQKDWLIVNGCAGSGKTTILLQRIAYLMYQSKDQSHNDMLLLSRNQLFAKYISHVIPNLTGSELYQQTLAQHTVELFKKFFLNKTSMLVPTKTRRAYLTDSEWAALIAEQLPALSVANLHFRPISIKGFRIFGEKDYQKIIEQVNPKLTLYQQLVQIQEVLEKNLKRRLNRFYVSEVAKRVYEDMSPMQIEVLMKNEEFNSETEYYQMLGQRVFEKQSLEAEQQVEMFAFVNFAKHLQDWMPLAKQRREELGKVDNAQLPLKDTGEGRLQVTAEGVRVLLYVATMIAPIRDYQGYTHLFIDEVQDVSLLFMAALSNYYFRAKFTVVGDTFQSFSTATTIFSLEERHPELVAAFFKERVLEHRSLEISYRCTAQITRFANGILGWELDKNVFPRTGEEVGVFVDEEPSIERLKKLVEDTPECYHTNAIFCRTMDEAKALQKELVEYDAELLEDTSESLGSRLVVTTIEVAKGLEFDQVFIWQATKDRYATMKERFMFYTTCTRAKHRLNIFTTPEVTSFIANSKAPMSVFGTFR